MALTPRGISRMQLFKNTTIIGVGLLGGSLAKACRAQGLTETITGYGRNQGNLQEAKKQGIIDNAAPDIHSAVKDADLIILCSPVGAMIPLVREMAASLKPGCLITDAGSVKGALVGEIESLIPETTYFVGAHPIAGGERSGLGASTATLFQGANCIVTPTANTCKEALQKITQLWKQVGMNTITMDVDEHDFIFGAVSHLPHVIAFALMVTLGDIHTKNYNDITTFSGAGLRDITRIASSDPVMWRDIFLSNQKQVLLLIDQFQETLTKLKEWIEKSEGQNLEQSFKAANKYRLNLT